MGSTVQRAIRMSFSTNTSNCRQMRGHSIHQFLKRFKPGAPRRAHLFAAGLLWSCVGVGLLIRGSTWLYGENRLVLIVPAILLGTLKSLFLLDKSARKSIDRILLLDDGSCLGAVYSIRTWMLVVAMMLSGMVLRRLPVTNEIIGILYAAVGWSLLCSSRLGWKAWYETGKNIDD